ncbi:MAG: hypothetical protein ACRC02_07855, partial [Vogesella sp.]|uniref:hypothetical protein n=1 Tax=Vogesella sp. TaxID=1904252 RepID=UPI003F337AF7
ADSQGRQHGNAPNFDKFCNGILQIKLIDMYRPASRPSIANMHYRYFYLATRTAGLEAEKASMARQNG